MRTAQIGPALRLHLKCLLNLVLVLSMLTACEARLAFQREDQDSVLSL